ncbi:MAG: hypothetical protein Fur003_4510 [Candidatus Dojkabacteria bacterium]
MTPSETPKTAEILDVSSYDKFDYDYKEYWNERGYENAAEANALANLLKKSRGARFLDVGGSFGRNLPLYAGKYDEVVIIDYSLNTLLKYEKEILNRFPNARLVAGNIYKMPFAKGSFDGALMVRVLHHIENPALYYKELSQIMAQNGLYIQEFANKMHIKAVLKWLLKRDFSKFNQLPYQQPTTDEKQGSEDAGIFYNFHPKHIKQLLKENDFKITAKRNCSYLRVPFLKRLLGNGLLITFEKLFQATLSWTDITPSIIYKTRKLSGSKANSTKAFKEILVCPTCKKGLNVDQDEAICPECNTKYKKYSTVWDLRA